MLATVFLHHLSLFSGGLVVHSIVQVSWSMFSTPKKKKSAVYFIAVPPPQFTLSHDHILVCHLILSSPTGQQFLSCKEVASFLESFFGLNNAERQDGDGGEDIQEDCIVATENVSIFL